MRGNGEVLALVVARGGSKGILRKNLVPLGGRPLLAWSLDAALRARTCDRVVVSTEDAEIAEVARCFGAHEIVARPAALARDDTPTMPVVFHALAAHPDAEYVVLLQPTSPLRLPEDIDACVDLCRRHAGHAVVSVTLADPSPHLMVRLDPEACLQPVLDALPGAVRRQDLPPTHVLNGAVYVAGRAWLNTHGRFVTPETRGFVMPRERSVDIDDELDLALAGLLLERSARVAPRAA